MHMAPSTVDDEKDGDGATSHALSAQVCCRNYPIFTDVAKYQACYAEDLTNF